MSNELLTSPEVAAKLGKSTRTVHRLVDSGDLTYVKKFAGPNGAYLFDAAAVDAYIAKIAAPVAA